MSHLTPFRPADPTAELIRRATFQRPDLAAALTDDGWVAVRISDLLLTSAGLAFAAGDVVLARPATARSAADFIAFSERLSSLVGLRHGEHFAFRDEERAA